jgi:inward rectifier potassium channel
LATVGYGHAYRDTLYGHCVTTLEIMVGLFGLAVMTGLIFVRFSRPTARMMFSNVAVVAPFDCCPTLMLRLANLRHHAMVEAEFRLLFMRSELTKEGKTAGAFIQCGCNSIT